MEPEYCPYCKSEDVKETTVIGFYDDEHDYRTLTEHVCSECGEMFYTP